MALAWSGRVDRDRLHFRRADDIDALLEIAQTMALPGERPPWLVLEALLASYRAHLYRGDLTAAGAALDAFGREAGERGIPEAMWHHDFFRAQRVHWWGSCARHAAPCTAGRRLGAEAGRAVRRAAGRVCARASLLMR